jgi:hypothetical protein
MNKYNVKVGDIVLYSGTGLLPRLIQLFQKNKYNHAGLVVEAWGKLFILEAAAEGVVLNTIEDSFKGSKQIVMRPTFITAPTIDVESSKEFSKFAIELTEGRKYDYAALLWHQLIFKLTGRRRWVGRKFTAGEKLYCSELCAYVYNQLYDLFPVWYKTSPAMLQEDTVNFSIIKDLVYKPTGSGVSEDKLVEENKR